MSQELNGFLSNESNLSGSINNGANLIGSFVQSGGGGTSDYNDLSNKPSINNVTLSGNKTSHDLGLMPETTLAAVATSGDYDDLIDKPVLSEVATTGDYDDLINKPVIPDMSGYYDKTETDALLADKFDKDDVTWATFANKIDVAIVERAVDAHGNYYNTITNQGIGPFYTQTETDNLLSAKANTADLATVATTGDYDDLTNKPVIPTIDLGSNNKMVMLEDHLGSTPVTTAAGSLYRSAEKTFNFSGFTNVKAIFATGANATGSTSSWIAITSRTNSSVSFVVMRYNSATLSDYTVSFLIIGE